MDVLTGAKLRERNGFKKGERPRERPYTRTKTHTYILLLPSFFFFLRKKENKTSRKNQSDCAHPPPRLLCVSIRASEYYILSKVLSNCIYLAYIHTHVYIYIHIGSINGIRTRAYVYKYMHAFG